MSLAANHVTLSLGASLAPLLVAAMAPRYGWQSVFMLCGAFGFLWIPLWALTTRRIPAPTETERSERAPVRILWRDGRLWGLIIANALIMTVYTVWTNWTTIYLVQEHHLTPQQANQGFAWIPPIFATAGGFVGGWLALRWIGRGTEVLNVRLRLGWLAAALLLTTAVLPAVASPRTAVAVISASMFCCMILQTNLHAMPIDLLGVRNAGFSVSTLAASYGLVQMILSPLIGAMVDRVGFAALSLSLAVLPLAGMLVLGASLRGSLFPSWVVPGDRILRLEGKS